MRQTPVPPMPTGTNCLAYSKQRQWRQAHQPQFKKPEDRTQSVTKGERYHYGNITGTLNAVLPDGWAWLIPDNEKDFMVPISEGEEQEEEQDWETELLVHSCQLIPFASLKDK